MTRYRQVYDALIALYGEPDWRPHLSPVDELVCTILSQNTNDVNRDVAFRRLGDRFGPGNWVAVRDAPLEQVIEAIRPAGLAQQKGPRIQNALRVLAENGSEINMDFLADMPLAEAKEWLTSLPGVGPKTAAVVLLFAFGRPAFPVDTHVHRVTRRIGLIPADTSAPKAHDLLEMIVPPDHYYAFHLNLIRHGRETCQARRPKCDQCSLGESCDFYSTLKAS